MQNVSLGYNLYEMSNSTFWRWNVESYFLGKKYKIIISLSSAEFSKKEVKVK